MLQPRGSAYTAPLLDVIDELGYSIVSANKAFSALAAGEQHRVALYDALKAIEQLCRIKNVPLDDLMCREDGTPIVPHLQSSLTHSEFLRSLLRFQRAASNYEATDEIESEFKSAAPPVDFATRDVRMGEVGSPRALDSPRPSSPRVGTAGHSHWSTNSSGSRGKQHQVPVHDEAELDKVRRARIRRLESDAAFKPLPVPMAPRSPRAAGASSLSLAPSPLLAPAHSSGAAQPKQQPQSQPHQSQSQSQSQQEPAAAAAAAAATGLSHNVRVVERDHFPSFADATEPVLVFVTLDFWSALARLQAMFAPADPGSGSGSDSGSGSGSGSGPTSAERAADNSSSSSSSKMARSRVGVGAAPQSRNQLRRLVARCFAEEDVNSLYFPDPAPGSALGSAPGSATLPLDPTQPQPQPQAQAQAQAHGQAQAQAQAQRKAADLCIERADFARVMANPRLGLWARVSPSLAWAPRRAWWDLKLVEVTSVSSRPGSLLGWTDFCVALEVLSRFAAQQAARLRQVVAGEIVRNATRAALARAERRLAVLEAEAAMRAVARRRDERQREREERERERLQDLDRARAAAAAAAAAASSAGAGAGPVGRADPLEASYGDALEASTGARAEAKAEAAGAGPGAASTVVDVAVAVATPESRQGEGRDAEAGAKPQQPQHPQQPQPSNQSQSRAEQPSPQAAAAAATATAAAAVAAAQRASALQQQLLPRLGALVERAVAAGVDVGAVMANIEGFSADRQLTQAETRALLQALRGVDGGEAAALLELVDELEAANGSASAPASASASASAASGSGSAASASAHAQSQPQFRSEAQAKQVKFTGTGTGVGTGASAAAESKTAGGGLGRGGREGTGESKGATSAVSASGGAGNARGGESK